VNNQFRIQRDILGESVDIFGEYYESIRGILSEAAQNEDVTTFAETIRVALNDASNLFQRGKITKDAFDAFKTLTDQYLGFNKVVQDNPLFPIDQVQTFLDLEEQILRATGEITVKYNDQTGAVERVTEKVTNYADLQEKQNVLLTQYGEIIKQKYTEELKLQDLIGEGREKNINSLLEQNKITKEQAQDLLALKFVEDQENKLALLINQIVEARITALKKVTLTIVQEENQIREFLFRVCLNLRQLRNASLCPAGKR
jgi:hypothetical protein